MLMMLAALGKIGGDCGVNARQLMLMMLAALGKLGGDCGVNARQLMLMMLAALGKIGGRLWSNRQAADAHDAGGFGENWEATVEYTPGS